MGSALDSLYTYMDLFIENEEMLMRYLCYVMLFNGAMSFLLLQCFRSPYGRHGSSAWGPPVNVKFAWFTQELPSFAIPVFLLFYTDCIQLANISNRIMLGLYLLHYVQRTFIYPFLIKGGKPSPFIPYSLAVMFCAANGYLQGRNLTHFATFSRTWTSSAHFLIGVPMFLIGFGMNVHSDHILRNLRKPGEVGYKIPTGGLFEFVSAANFLGEIIEWSGFACAAWNLPAFSFAAFTALNLIPRAVQHHRWYKKKFENYPKARRAIIPFIW